MDNPLIPIYDPAEDETIVAENISFEEFLVRFSEVHAEWLMGKVIIVVANNAQHQKIILFLIYVMKLFLTFKPKGQLQLAGMPMKVGSDKPAREPDILFILNEHEDRIKSTYIDGPADLVIEVVSPESTDRDRGKKFHEYEAAGVPEYWLVDPLRTESVIYVLGADGRYHPVAPDDQGRLYSAVLPGLYIIPEWLWREKLPEGPELITLVQAMAG
jgi:Uma2 family endonuclease